MTRIRLGFVGCGEVAVEKHMPAIAELREFEVVAVADADPARLRYVDARFHVPHRYADLAGLLAHPGLDAVAVCLPPSLQVEASVAALDAGKHVWVEPPLGLSLPECDRLIERARRSPQTVMVGFHMRWHRLVRQAREVVRGDASAVCRRSGPSGTARGTTTRCRNGEAAARSGAARSSRSPWTTSTCGATCSTARSTR